MNTNMRGNSLLELQRLGQSIWIDYIHRGMLGSGELAGLIEDGVRGVTTNPSLFEKAIDGSHEYDGDIEELALRDCSPPEIYEALAVQDVQMAADRLRPYYDRLKGRDGFVSLEVSPLLAHDPERTVAEARRAGRTSSSRSRRPGKGWRRSGACSAKGST
jgi:transaldolase